MLQAMNNSKDTYLREQEIREAVDGSPCPDGGHLELPELERPAEGPVPVVPAEGDLDRAEGALDRDGPDEDEVVYRREAYLDCDDEPDHF